MAFLKIQLQNLLRGYFKAIMYKVNITLGDTDLLTKSGVSQVPHESSGHKLYCRNVYEQ